MSKAGEEEKEFAHLTDEVAQDAYDSWNMLAARLDMLPEGARQYFERLCAKVQEFDPHEDSELVLTNHLEHVEIKSKIEVGERKPLGWKSKHDYAHVFDWVTDHRKQSGCSMEEAIFDFLDEHDLKTEEFDAVDRAYQRVRRARLESADQLRED